MTERNAGEAIPSEQDPLAPAGASKPSTSNPSPVTPEGAVNTAEPFCICDKNLGACAYHAYGDHPEDDPPAAPVEGAGG